jgi:hypothetical protein
LYEYLYPKEAEDERKNINLSNIAEKQNYYMERIKHKRKNIENILKDLSSLTKESDKKKTSIIFNYFENIFLNLPTLSIIKDMYLIDAIMKQ